MNGMNGGKVVLDDGGAVDGYTEHGDRIQLISRTRDSASIAGSAVAELMRRTVYLEGVVQAREAAIADLLEKLEEEREVGRKVAEKIGGDLQKATDLLEKRTVALNGAERALRFAESGFEEIREATKRRPLGPRSRPIRDYPETGVGKVLRDLEAFRRGGGSRHPFPFGWPAALGPAPDSEVSYPE